MSRLAAASLEMPEIRRIRKDAIAACETRFLMQGQAQFQACRNAVLRLSARVRAFPYTKAGLTHLRAKVPVEQAFGDCDRAERDLYKACETGVVFGEKVLREILDERAVQEREDLMKQKPVLGKAGRRRKARCRRTVCTR